MYEPPAAFHFELHLVSYKTKQKLTIVLQIRAFHYQCTGSCTARNLCAVRRRAVVVFCHSKMSVMARFLFHAQDRNMTNGDFAFFTFRFMRSFITDRPWNLYVADPVDLPRRRRAFYAVKQVRVNYR